LAFDDHLGGDARVVGPGEPQRRLAPHAREPGQHILQGVVQRMADVQGAGDVGRRYDDGEGRSGRIIRGREGAGRLPLMIEARFSRLGIEGFVEHGEGIERLAVARKGRPSSRDARAGSPG